MLVSIKILNLFIYILIYFIFIKLKLTWKCIFSFLWKWNECLLMDQQELNKKGIHKIKSMNEYPFKLHNLLTIYSYMMKKNHFSIFFFNFNIFSKFHLNKKKVSEGEISFKWNKSTETYDLPYEYFWIVNLPWRR